LPAALLPLELEVDFEPELELVLPPDPPDEQADSANTLATAIAVTPMRRFFIGSITSLNAATGRSRRGDAYGMSVTLGVSGTFKDAVLVTIA
jgi:hypothetical protein